MSNIKATLKYNWNYYLPTAIKYGLEHGQEAEIRAEYSRLRGIAIKRIQRLEKADMTDTQAYLKNYKHYPKLKDIKSKTELASRLSDLSRFIDAKASTVSGQNEIRAKAIATLHENGYDFVNSSNIVEFGRFMEEYRKQKMDDAGYDSGDAAELYSVVEKHKIDPADVEADFELWLKNLDTAKSLRRSKASQGNYEKIKSRLEKKKPSRRARYTGKRGKSSKSGKSGRRRR